MLFEPICAGLDSLAPSGGARTLPVIADGQRRTIGRICRTASRGVGVAAIASVRHGSQRSLTSCEEKNGRAPMKLGGAACLAPRDGILCAERRDRLPPDPWRPPDDRRLLSGPTPPRMQARRLPVSSQESRSGSGAERNRRPNLPPAFGTVAHLTQASSGSGWRTDVSPQSSWCAFGLARGPVDVIVMSVFVVSRVLARRYWESPPAHICPKCLNHPGIGIASNK